VRFAVCRGRRTPPLGAFLTLFVVTTLSGWSAPLWRVQRVTNGWLPFAIFTGVILCGSYLIISLLIAELLTRFQTSVEQHREDEAAAAARDAALERSAQRARRVRVLLKIARVFNVAAWRRITVDDATTLLAGRCAAARRGRRADRALRGRLRGALGGASELAWARLRRTWALQGLAPRSGRGAKLREFVMSDDTALGRTIHFAILFNLIALALDGHGIAPALATGLQIANAVFTWLFFSELLIKWTVPGMYDYYTASPGMNAFDTAIVMSSLVEIALSDSSSGGALRIVRMCRLVRAARAGRLARRWPALRTVAQILVHSSEGLAPVMLLLLLFLFVAALLGMQLFGATFDGGRADDDVARDDAAGLVDDDELASSFADISVSMRFDSFGWAMIECFHVLCGEGWSGRMYAAMVRTGSGASFLYFVVILVFGQYVERYRLPCCCCPTL